MSASVTLMVQVAPSFEACQKPGPLDSYPVWVVAMVVMLPSLLVASLEPLLVGTRLRIFGLSLEPPILSTRPDNRSRGVFCSGARFNGG